jgi:hypothetical protein
MKGLQKIFRGLLIVTILSIISQMHAYAQSNLDVGIMQLNSPLAPHTGTNKAISVRVRNFGNVPVTSLKIGWRVNNGPVTDYIWVGAMPASSNANQIPTTNIVVAGTYADNPGVTLEVFIKEVNNQNDNSTANDTLRATFGTAISGTKIIGIAPSDYRNINDVVNAMRYNGINGNVTVKVKPGTYNENFELVGGDLNYSGGNHNISFESQTGKRDVIMVSEAAVQSTIRLNGADRITIKGFRVVNRNIVSGIGIQMLTSADRNTVDNCEITVDSISNNRGFAGILLGAMGNSPTYTLTTNPAAKFATISNCKISGGYYGIAVSGGITPRDTAVIIENNTISQVVYFGVYVNNGNNTKIRKNSVQFRPSSADKKSTGYWLTNINTTAPGNIEITRNYVSGAGQHGIYMSAVNGTGPSTNRYVNVYNNMIAGEFFSNAIAANDIPRGLSINNCGWVNVYFNSVLMDAPINIGVVDNTAAFYVIGTTTIGSIRVYNNIFAQNNLGYAYYNASAAASNPVIISDNNDLWVKNFDPANNPTTGFAWWNGAARLGLIDLRQISSREANSISKDPSFFSSTDLHTLSNDLNQKGNTAALTEVPIDFDGELRDQVNQPDIGCDEFGPGGDDFAVVGISPDVFRYNAPTPWNFTIRYQGNSNGNKPLFILYKINGVDQLDADSAIQILPTQLSTYFRTQTFQVPVNRRITRTTYQQFKLTVYIYGGNIGDLRPANDSLTIDVCVGLEGIFTIDPNQAPSLSNFTSFQEIYDYLKCGVAGPTVFEIADGTYDEQINLWKIRNSSAVNNITFKSKNNVFATKLTYINGTAENHATVLFNNAQYITLKDLTIENRSTSNGSCIQFAGNSKYNTITNCIIRVDSTITPYPLSLVPIVSSKLGTLMNTTVAPQSYGVNGNFNKIVKNKIFGGYYGIAMFGQDTAIRDKENFIENNIITSFHKAGVYLDFADTRVLHNIITGKLGMDGTAWGIYAKGLGDRNGDDKNNISGNKIYDVSFTGIFLQSCLSKKFPGQKKSSFVVSNNMIGGGFTTFSTATAGINMNGTVGVSVLHNTILMDAPRASGTAVSENVARCMIVNNTNDKIEAFNNILYSTNGAIALEYYTRIRNQGSPNTGLSAADNNLYYTESKSKSTPLILIQRISNLNATKKNYIFGQTSQSPLVAMTEFKNENNNSSRERKTLALPIKFEQLPYDLHSYDLTIESKAAGGQDITTDFDRDPRKGINDIGADEFTVPNYDLDVNAVMNPLICFTKPNKIVVKLRNRGKYSLDGIKVPMQYTMSDGEGGFTFTGYDTVRLTLKKTGDTQIFTFKTLCSVPERGIYNLCIKISPGWGVADTVYSNNEKCREECTGIEGDYFIGYQSPFPSDVDSLKNFAAVQPALDFIKANCGVCDDINLNIKPSATAYAERINIPRYLVNLDSPIVTLQPHNTSLNSAVVINQPIIPAGDKDRIHYTIRFDGSRFVRLKNLTIRNTGLNFGSGIHFTKESRSNIVEGCRIEVNTTSINKEFYPIVFTSTSKMNVDDNNSFAKNGSFNRIVRNQIIGGFAGVALMGSSVVDFDESNIVDSNIISEFYQYGVFAKYNTVKSIGFNILEPRLNSSASCVSISYNFGGAGGLINANKIVDAKQVGIKIIGVDANFDNRLIVANNWITHNFGTSVADTSAALLIKRSSNIGIYYNSIRYNGLVSALSMRSENITLPDPETGNPTTVKISPTNIHVKNNIVMVDSVPGAAQIPFVIYFDSNDPRSQFNNNNYFTGYQSKFAYYPPNTQKDFATWELNTAQDDRSIDLLPGFISGIDLNLSPDTLQFDKKGIVVPGISRDFYNRKRSPRVTDIGSIEYEKQWLDVSLLNIKNEKAVYGQNDFTVTILNDGNADISDKTICLEYSVDSGQTWIGTENVQLTKLKARYDEQEFTFSAKYNKTNFLVIPLCVRIVPTAQCRLVGDTITQYEKICKDLCVGLKKGDYTIGTNGTEDFSNFAQAITALVCGFDSSIVFKVSSGTYIERVTIPNINTNFDTTVTFTSKSGNAKDVTIQFQNTDEAVEHHVMQLQGTKHIIIKNLTFKSAAKARASGIHLADSAAYNRISNCIFEFDSTVDANTLVGVLGSGRIAFTDPASNNNNTIENCEFRGGGFGIRFLGVKNNATKGPNQIIGSKFRNQYTAAIDVFYSQIDSISNNEVHMRSGNKSSVGINIYGALTDFIITNNIIRNAQSAGFVMDSCRTISRGLIASNMIAGGFTPDGFGRDHAMIIKSTGAFPSKGVNSSGTIEILNNSVLFDGTSDSSSAFYIMRSNSLAIYNNIFVNYGNGYALLFDHEPNNGVTEFFGSGSNLLYTRGTNIAKWRGIVCPDLITLGLQDQGNSPFNVGNSPGGIGAFDPVFRSNMDLHINKVELDGRAQPFDNVVTDIDGQARNPSTPDVGCDEYIPGFDMSLLRFVTPVDGSSFQDSVRVTIQVKNKGADLTATKFKYTFDGKVVDSITQVFNPALKYDSTAFITFPKKFSTRQGGLHKLAAYSEILRLTQDNKFVNNDFNNFNDTIKIGVFSLDTSDLGVSAYLSPLNGLPVSELTNVEVKVTNYGNLRTSNYQLILKVNNQIVETRNITEAIDKKEARDYTFTYKIDPEKAVSFDICAYTRLLDDVLPENDSLCIAVSTLVSIVNNAKNTLFSVFPNPTTGKVYYGIDLDADAEVEIKVYDLSGRLVKLEKAGTLTKGKHSIETNNETLAEGTYFFVLKAGDQSYNGRFVIVK